MSDRSALFQSLRRRPDVEDPALQAWDAADSLILDEAHSQGPLGDAVVIGDRHGALTLGALAEGATSIRVHQDMLVGERALDANAAQVGESRFTHHGLDASLVTDARLVLLQLPRGLDALDEIAALIAQYAHPSVRVVAGGRDKHMSVAMNAVLARHFADVTASRGRQKSRVLHASGPRAADPALPDAVWPKRETHEIAGCTITVVAHGAAFAGTRIDHGARALLAHLPKMPEAPSAIDLACGTGVLGTVLALSRPGIRVLASDASAAAVDSARATVAASGVADRVDVRRMDGLEAVADASCPLILLNPPFHVGAAVHTGIAERLMWDAGRALAPGGELWCVWNAHLGYRSLLDRLGRTRQVSRDPRFVVTATRR